MTAEATRGAPREVSIWWWAFGYWASYVPYGALTKALSEGALPGMEGRVDGFTLLPANALASLAATGLFLGATGWWRDASRARVGEVTWPAPSRLAALSGLCAATITVTTTLAYTFEGTSIVLMMLLMRGLVLALAPVIDLLTRRPVRARSWVALGLSFAALAVAFRARGSLAMSASALVCLALYAGAYFVRLQVMSRAAKSAGRGEQPALLRRRAARVHARGGGDAGGVGGARRRPAGRGAPGGPRGLLLRAPTRGRASRRGCARRGRASSAPSSSSTAGRTPSASR
jgi:hypothetical protein